MLTCHPGINGNFFPVKKFLPGKKLPFLPGWRVAWQFHGKNRFCAFINSNRNRFSQWLLMSGIEISSFHGLKKKPLKLALGMKKFPYLKPGTFGNPLFHFRWVRRSRLVKSMSKAFKDSNIVRPLPQLSDGPSSSSSPRKSSNRLQPIFAIFFKCPQKEIDFTFEPRKTEVEFQYRDSVENFIHGSIRKVLEENYLLVPDAMTEKVSVY